MQFARSIYTSDGDKINYALRNNQDAIEWLIQSALPDSPMPNNSQLELQAFPSRNLALKYNAEKNVWEKCNAGLGEQRFRVRLVGCDEDGADFRVYGVWGEGLTLQAAYRVMIREAVKAYSASHGAVGRSGNRDGDGDGRKA